VRLPGLKYHANDWWPWVLVGWDAIDGSKGGEARAFVVLPTWVTS